MPSRALHLSAQDLSPGIDGVEQLIESVKEMKVCKKLFDGWMHELDRQVSTHILQVPLLRNSYDIISQRGSWTQKNEMEHRLVWSIDKLRMDADSAYEAAKRLLVSRRSFANAMSDMLDASTDSGDSSENGDFIFRNNKRVMHSGDTIVMHSMALSEQVAMMQEELAALVDMIDQWKKKEKKKSSIFPTLWDWILKGFTSILSLVAAGTAFVPTIRPLGAIASNTLHSGARLATALSDLVQRSQGKDRFISPQ